MMDAPAHAAEWVPADYFARADLRAVFPRSAPLEVDLGCGDGDFLVERARLLADHNFLGTERMPGRVDKVCRKVARIGLPNVRVLRLESAYVVKHLLPPESVAIAHVLFPDPWPKRQHHPRRLIQEEFLQSVRGVLQPGGELRLKTDDLPYFRWMEKVIEQSPGFERIDWPEDPDYPLTNFERRFVAQALPIHRARLRKV
jgi:tRNA (guanine-N7-)-methyltransferase